MNIPTPKTDAIRKNVMAGEWNLTQKGGLLDSLEEFEQTAIELASALDSLIDSIPLLERDLYKEPIARARTAISKTTA